MLEEYKKKRDFKKTSEPLGDKIKIKDALIYVVQKHQAHNLHYDLRLEKDGVLISFAIPKKPENVTGIKRLAIKTEDHPIDYATFEGLIPKGEYGAGKVEIWDKGFFNWIDFKDKKYIVNIQGKKLNGEFVLLRFERAGSNQWLFFKKKDHSAQ